MCFLFALHAFYTVSSFPTNHILTTRGRPPRAWKVGGGSEVGLRAGWARRAPTAPLHHVYCALTASPATSDISLNASIDTVGMQSSSEPSGSQPHSRSCSVRSFTGQNFRPQAHFLAWGERRGRCRMLHSRTSLACIPTSSPEDVRRCKPWQVRFRPVVSFLPSTLQ